jgi:hypothetical protein
MSRPRTDPASGGDPRGSAIRTPRWARIGSEGRLSAHARERIVGAEAASPESRWILPRPGAALSEIRVLFASLPGMLSDIIRQAVENEPDLRVAEERATLDGLADAVGRTHPHVLVVGSGDAALPRECLRAMLDRPHPNTLSVSLDGRLASAYRLRPYGVVRENLSAADVVAAIRELHRPLPELEG